MGTDVSHVSGRFAIAKEGTHQICRETQGKEAKEVYTPDCREGMHVFVEKPRKDFVSTHAFLLPLRSVPSNPSCTMTRSIALALLGMMG